MKQRPSHAPSLVPADARTLEHRQLRGRDRTFLASRWFSLRAAAAGVLHTLRTQPNAWIEVSAIAVVTVAAWWFRLSALEWALLGLTFFLVLALEAVNTALEA